MNLCHQNHNEHVQLVYDEQTKNYLNYRQLICNSKYKEVWLKSAANKFGRLAQGIQGRVKGTDTIRFIRKDKVPPDRWKDIKYGSFTCDMKPNKEEKERTRLTAGGDCINYPDDVGTPTADMTLFKCLANSIISTPGAHCIMIDIKDFYLNTPMKRYEYMRLKESDIPEEVIDEYKLPEIMTEDKYIYCEIRKEMCGLPQAGIIAQELLAERLAKHGYHQSKIIPGLWTHETRPIIFTLVVDDFAIKIMSEKVADHLINALKKDYTITVDREATKIHWSHHCLGL
jgi:hypothetical protein